MQPDVSHKPRILTLISSATARSRLAKFVAKKKLGSQEKFKTAIGKILSGEYDRSVGKAQLTKIVNQWEKEESADFMKKAIEEILVEITIPESSKWIQQRYTYVPGYFWLENSSKYGDTVLGWYDATKQIQAEPLPLEMHCQRHEDKRYCKVLGWGWESKGFAAAEELPFCWSSSQVSVPTENLQLFCKHGYASPCELQWERRCNQHDSQENGLYVKRSIISYGFWQAWKWWPDAWAWYYEHRPELFEDASWWGKEELVRHEPPDPYAAVFSPNNSESLKSRLFYLDDK